MSHMASPSRRGPQNRVTKRPWTQDETNLLVMSLQAGYPYGEIRRKFFQRRSIRACKARIETLEKNGMLASFLPIASQSSLTAGSRTGESHNEEVSTRRRSNPSRRSRFPGLHTDQSLASAGEATDATYMSPDMSDVEDGDDSYVETSSHIDVLDVPSPSVHTMDAPASPAIMAPADETVSQIQPQINVSVEQTAPSISPSQEAPPAEVEARRLHNSVRRIWNQISQFYIKYPGPDVNAYQIDEWHADCEDIRSLLWLWPRELPPQYAVVNEEIPMDAPTNLILAHLEYRVAQIKWYGPMRNCDPLRRPNGIFRSPEQTCVNAAREIVSIVEQHLRRTPLGIMGPHSNAVASATLTAFNALKDRGSCPDQDILMAQRFAQMLPSFLNILVSDVCGNLATSTELLPPGSTPCIPMNAPNTLRRGPGEVPDASNQHNNPGFVPSPSTRTGNGPLNEEEANMNAHASAAGPSNLIGGPNNERQRRQAAASPLTYGAPSEISQNPFSELGQFIVDDSIFDELQS
ncbi:hypothetical protein FOPE_06740 [Fonsecaea pedrosoi]|nr:hypothetical protein FOPE_06740 [Fonsecaea pedrosoi]